MLANVVLPKQAPVVPLVTRGSGVPELTILSSCMCETGLHAQCLFAGLQTCCGPEICHDAVTELSLLYDRKIAG